MPHRNNIDDFRHLPKKSCYELLDKHKFGKLYCTIMDIMIYRGMDLEPIGVCNNTKSITYDQLSWFAKHYQEDDLLKLELKNSVRVESGILVVMNNGFWRLYNKIRDNKPKSLIRIIDDGYVTKGIKLVNDGFTVTFEEKLLSIKSLTLLINAGIRCNRWLTSSEKIHMLENGIDDKYVDYVLEHSITSHDDVVPLIKSHPRIVELMRGRFKYVEHHTTLDQLNSGLYEVTDLIKYYKNALTTEGLETIANYITESQEPVELTYKIRHDSYKDDMKKIMMLSKANITVIIDHKIQCNDYYYEMVESPTIDDLFIIKSHIESMMKMGLAIKYNSYPMK